MLRCLLSVATALSLVPAAALGAPAFAHAGQVRPAAVSSRVADQMSIIRRPYVVDDAKRSTRQPVGQFWVRVKLMSRAAPAEDDRTVVTGRLTYDGRPLAGLDVHAVHDPDARTATDQDGRFRKGFKATKDGTWRAYYGGTAADAKTYRDDYVDVR
ncbi:hypothetical protein ACIBF1_42330 [Spirillospora sp. NPDC050679]